jgi:hypothetical protein
MFDHRLADKVRDAKMAGLRAERDRLNALAGKPATVTGRRHPLPALGAPA